MPEILELTSNHGLVKFSQEDLIQLGLVKWIRTSFKGIGKRGLIQDTPFETAAAKAYVDKNPQVQVHIAEKCLLNQDNSVDVVLKISNAVSSEMYNQHSNSTILRKQKKTTANIHILTKYAAGYFEGHIERVMPQVDPDTGETEYHVKDFSTGIRKAPLEISEEFDANIGIDDVNGNIIKIGDTVDILTDFVGIGGTRKLEVNILGKEDLKSLPDEDFAAYMEGMGLNRIKTKDQLDRVSDEEFLQYAEGLESRVFYQDPTDQNESVIDRGIIRFWTEQPDPEYKMFVAGLKEYDPRFNAKTIENTVVQLYQEELRELPETRRPAFIKKMVKEETAAMIQDELDDQYNDVAYNIPWAIVDLIDPVTGETTGEMLRIVHYQLDKVNPGESLEQQEGRRASAVASLFDRRIAFWQKLGSGLAVKLATEKENATKAYDANQMTELPKGSQLDVTFPEKEKAELEDEQKSFHQVLDDTIKEANSSNTSSQISLPSQQVSDETTDSQSDPTHDTSEEDVSKIYPGNNL